MTRTVNVADDDPPVISLNGPATINLAFGQPYVEQGATATDNVDATVTVNIGGATVNPNVPGTYIVAYNAQDSAGNVASEVTRTVNVAGDGNPPVITLNGPATINLGFGDTYTEQGATANDPEEGAVAVTIGGATVNTNQAGTYVVTYNAQDSSGNAATQVTRTVNVAADGNPPVITLNGPATINLDFGEAYVEQGASANDPEEGPVAVTIGGATVNPNQAGTYVVTYNAQDSSGNSATQVTRTVNVAADGTPPVITRNGPATITINVGDSFSDPGATASDPEEGPVPVVVGGDTVNPNVAGTYVITYDAQDSIGNSAVQVTRTVIVNAPPTITIIGDNPAAVAEGEPYNDEGATANDPEDGVLTNAIPDDKHGRHQHRGQLHSHLRGHGLQRRDDG